MDWGVSVLSSACQWPLPLTKRPQTVLTGSSVSEWCGVRRFPGPGGGWSLQDGTEKTQGCQDSGGPQEERQTQASMRKGQ